MFYLTENGGDQAFLRDFNSHQIRGFVFFFNLSLTPLFPIQPGTK